MQSLSFSDDDHCDGTRVPKDDYMGFIYSPSCSISIIAVRKAQTLHIVIVVEDLQRKNFEEKLSN